MTPWPPIANRSNRAAPPPPRTPRSWREAFVRYLRSECHLAENTVLAYDRDLRRFFTWLGGRRIEGLSISDLSGYPAWLTAAATRPASISRHVVSLKVFFRYLQLEGVLTENQAELLGTQKLWQRVPTVLSPDEIDALLTAPKPPQPWPRRDRAMLELLYATGCRVSELSSSRVRDVHLDERYCLCHGKGDKQRVVPLGKKAVAAVRDVSAARAAETGGPPQPTPSEFLLLSPRGARLRRERIWELIKRLRQAEPAARPNSARTRCATASPRTSGRRRRLAASAGNARPRQHRHDADLHPRRPHAAQEGPRRSFIRGREDRGTGRRPRLPRSCSCRGLPWAA